MEMALSAFQSAPRVVYSTAAGAARHEQAVEQRTAQLQLDLRAGEVAVAQSEFQRKIVPQHLLHLDESGDRALGLQSHARLPMVVCGTKRSNSGV